MTQLKNSDRICTLFGIRSLYVVNFTYYCSTNIFSGSFEKETTIATSLCKSSNQVSSILIPIAAIFLNAKISVNLDNSAWLGSSRTGATTDEGPGRMNTDTDSQERGIFSILRPVT